MLRTNATDMCVACWVDSPTDFDTIVVLNNFIGDAQFWGGAAKTHSNNRYLDAPEGYTMGGSESVTTKAAAITNYATQVYTPVADGPLDGTGTDPSAYLDTATWPDYNFNVDIAGNAINWAGSPEIGAYQFAAGGGPVHYLLLRKP
jgi:hypothetical protein